MKRLLSSFLEWCMERLSRFIVKKSEWKPPLRDDFHEYVKGQRLDQLPPRTRKIAAQRVLQNRKMFK